MPTAYLYSRDDRFYCAKQTVPGTIRNSEGVASLATTDACYHKSFTARPVRGRWPASEKEANVSRGFIDRTRVGKRSGTASVTLPLRGGSAAGTAPDYGAILESAFGKATPDPGVSITYGPAGNAYLDEAAPVTCELWGFNAGGERGACAYGALVNSLRLTANADIAELSADFLCYYVLGQDRFANAATLEKGGLVAWPTEPATQTYTGSEVAGSVGAIELDQVDYDDYMRDVEVVINWNRAYRMDRFDVDGSEFFPCNPFELVPEVLLNVSLWSTDSADLKELLEKIAARTPFDAVVQIGATAGGIYTVSLANLIIPGEDEDPNHQDGDDRKIIRLEGLRAQASDVETRDEVKLVVT